MSNNTVKEEYIKTINGENYFLQCELRYSLGGYNVFTYKHEPRGYYVSVSPMKVVTLEGGGKMYEYTAFSGVKKLVYEVSRKSKKAEAEALKLYEDTKNLIINTHFADMVEQGV